MSRYSIEYLQIKDSLKFSRFLLLGKLATIVYLCRAKSRQYIELFTGVNLQKMSRKFPTIIKIKLLLSGRISTNYFFAYRDSYQTPPTTFHMCQEQFRHKVENCRDYSRQICYPMHRGIYSRQFFFPVSGTVSNNFCWAVPDKYATCSLCVQIVGTIHSRQIVLHMSRSFSTKHNFCRAVPDNFHCCLIGAKLPLAGLCQDLGLHFGFEW